MTFGRIAIVGLVLTGTWLLAHLYVGSRLLQPGMWPQAVDCAAWSLLALSWVLTPLAFTARFFLSKRRAKLLQVAGFTGMGLFAVLIVLVVVVDLVLVCAGLFGLHWETRWLWSGLLGVWAVLCAAGLRGAKYLPRTMEHEVVIQGLPPGLVGFRIAQVSDLHVGESISRERVEEVVAGVNALEPDLVAITGDLVDGSLEELSADVAPLAGLRARHGIFFVTGNHEYYSGAEAWCRHLSSLGMRVLQNEHVVLQHEGGLVAVAGVPDPAVRMLGTGDAPSLAKALAGVPESAFRLLLAHQPRIARESAGLGVQLQLSGHTHGGQFFPFTLLVGLFQPYVAGLYRVREMWLHVSRGTGHWGPPMRLASPQEISLLKLVV